MTRLEWIYLLCILQLNYWSLIANPDLFSVVQGATKPCKRVASPELGWDYTSCFKKHRQTSATINPSFDVVPPGGPGNYALNTYQIGSQPSSQQLHSLNAGHVDSKWLESLYSSSGFGFDHPGSDGQVITNPDQSQPQLQPQLQPQPQLQSQFQSQSELEYHPSVWMALSSSQEINHSVIEPAKQEDLYGFWKALEQFADAKDMLDSFSSRSYFDHLPTTSSAHSKGQAVIVSSSYNGAQSHSDVEHHNARFERLHGDAQQPSSGILSVNYLLQDQLVPSNAESYALDLKQQNMKDHRTQYFPSFFMSKTLEKKFFEPFKQATKEPLKNKKSPQRKYRKIFFTNIPIVAQVDESSRGSSGVFIRVVDAEKELLASSTMENSLKILIKWILFTYKTFAQSKAQAPSKPASNEKLLAWIHAELFSTTDSRLPVIGLVMRDIPVYDDSVFGFVQKRLISYLSLNDSAHLARKTSIAMVGIWLKNRNPAWWDQEFSGDDEKFWEFMCASTELAMNSRLTLDELESFRLTLRSSLIEIPQGLNIARLSFSSSSASALKKIQAKEKDVKIAEMEKGITDEINRLLGRYKLTDSYSATVIDDLWVMIAELQKERLEGVKLISIRLLNEDEKPLSRQKAERPVRYLLQELYHYHTIFLRFVSSKFKITIPDAHISLVGWLWRQLFSPGDDSLPVFGTVRTTIEKFTKNSFNDFQIYLINHLTKESSSIESERAAMSILGYWYKNYTQFWKDKIIDDSVYWNFLAEAVTSYKKHGVDKIND